MKTLLMMRHAKSSWKDASMADQERPLNKRGRRDAPRMGQRLQDAGLFPQSILSSTAERARQTATAVADATGFEGEIHFDATLYAAAPEAYLAALRGVPAETRVALLIGHNPGLEELLAELTGEAEHLATAAVAQVELPIENWADIGTETEARLVALWRPRDDS